MSTIYALLSDVLTPEQGIAFTDAVLDNGGRLTVLATPRAAIIDGDGTTAFALQQLVGNGVLAVGVDDVTPLTFAAFASPELAELVGILALTTPAATAAAEAVRPLPGEDWHGFPCVEGDA